MDASEQINTNVYFCISQLVKLLPDGPFGMLSLLLIPGRVCLVTRASLTWPSDGHLLTALGCYRMCFFGALKTNIILCFKMKSNKSRKRKLEHVYGSVVTQRDKL